ncbi:helix-turn-helix domain-containing protein [Burkholderia gladioli]|uniref:helix-turn-helix domain-containing protein n=1 Tax=Burkholderia gladioli TaxID=28095 RepID=UPI001364B4D6|nr:XRE family transcriptional regulator [Burkholderia gladioli]KAF1062252.1 HTH-type transcriptional regulator PuuR [Burkholderia gladioli]MBA1362201.1 helix-turn-helix domain-containing protein [Burkholderia gladioli]MBU9266677.1 XRE family transcriptional regulator [Burkholderia gladioli]MDN7498009.1 XRE family transcriptional regulator [Burkholderia gladioli]MDN7748988.1 XRE family transcriptional regulator [Burkholderia gladioli]
MGAIRLKLLRKQLGLSLQDLAERAGLTKSYLSKVERGLSTPSVAVAMQLATALHVEVGQLFASDEDEKAITVVRADERIRMGGGSEDGASAGYEVIAAEAGRKRLLPFMLQPRHDFSSSEFREHAGEEFLFVHSGRIEIDFASQKVTLGTGDAVYFNAQVPHRIRSLGARTAQVLLVISGDELSAAEQHAAD